MFRLDCWGQVCIALQRGNGWFLWYCSVYNFDAHTFFSGGHESAQTNVSCICGHSFCFRIDLQRKAKTCYNSLVECKIAMWIFGNLQLIPQWGGRIFSNLQKIFHPISEVCLSSSRIFSYTGCCLYVLKSIFLHNNQRYDFPNIHLPRKTVSSVRTWVAKGFGYLFQNRKAQIYNCLASFYPTTTYTRVEKRKISSRRKIFRQIKSLLISF